LPRPASGCAQVISLSEYRAQLFDYLKNRMQAIAPNLTVMVGELVGARLIAHAGSLMNLAKQPASTVQILGAEKALFRALKAKHDTPKYGLIYHASLVGQAQPKHKGKISRVLAAKCALSIRVDALGETSTATIGLDARLKVEERLRTLEGKLRTDGVTQQAKPKPQPTVVMAADTDKAKGYSVAADSTLLAPKEKKAKAAGEDDAKAAKKAKKAAKEAAAGAGADGEEKKRKREAGPEETKKKKEKKSE
jgi:nucleolar protein 58